MILVGFGNGNVTNLICKRRDIHTDAMGFAFPLVDLLLFCSWHNASVNAHMIFITLHCILYISLHGVYYMSLCRATFTTALPSPASLLHTDDKTWTWGVLKIMPPMESRIFCLILNLLYQRRRPSVLVQELHLLRLS